VLVADGPRRACSSRVLRLLAQLRFRSVVFLSFGWAKFRPVRVCRADSPFSGFATGGSVGFNGRSAALGRTVRSTGADSPRGLCGQSSPPGRTVRQCLAALFLGSIPPSFRASTCALRNRS
jgi:hypothetical protein